VRRTLQHHPARSQTKRGYCCADHTSPLFQVGAAACTASYGQTLGIFMGSMWTSTWLGSKLRQHLKGVASADPRVLVRESHRRGGGCEQAGSCVRNVGAGPPAKAEMAREMRRAAFCFVPPGDSATSSRLYDAVASLCVPIVIIGEPLWVPTSPFWTDAVVTVNATAFLRASPSAIVSFLREQLKRRVALCNALASLRDDLGAGCVLSRAIAGLERNSTGAQFLDPSTAVGLPDSYA
jgi:hypothetical protein